MQLKEAIENRRSIRKYKCKEVANDLIEDLIECARLAPSAKNRQPWEFLIVKNSTKNEIADLMLEKEKERNISLENKLLNEKSSVKATAKIIKEAPILILVFKQYNENWNIGDNLSIGAAIEHICLRATDLGLGSLWIRDTVYSQKEIAKLVGYENMELISAIAVGYPDEEPKQILRKKLEEILKWF